MEAFLNNFEVVFLILCRVSGIFVSSPFYGSRTIPKSIKSVLVLFIALTMFPVINKIGFYKVPTAFLEYILLIFQELGIGLIIGICATIVVNVFSISGGFYSLQMGIGMINVIDPLAQVQVPILGQLLGIIAVLIFLLCGAHHLLLIAVFKSYELLPAITISSFGPLCKNIIDMFVNSFVLGFSIALPIIGIMYILDIAIGLCSKASPQMNIMILGWPLKILIGFLTLAILLPTLFSMGIDIFDNLFNRIYKLLFEMGKAI
ncbi:MAG: flagellar biosynthetic protein FliR [bacterium]|nr:flagellar biosynthetic protein FliR [bacterium]